MSLEQIIKSVKKNAIILGVIGALALGVTGCASWMFQSKDDQEEQAQEDLKYQQLNEEVARNQIERTKKHFFACYDVGSGQGKAFPGDFFMKNTFNVDESLYLVYYDPRHVEGDMINLTIYGPDGKPADQHTNMFSKNLDSFDQTFKEWRYGFGVKDNLSLSTYLFSQCGPGDYKAVWSLPDGEEIGNCTFTVRDQLDSSRKFLACINLNGDPNDLLARKKLFSEYVETTNSFGEDDSLTLVSYDPFCKKNDAEKIVVYDPEGNVAYEKENTSPTYGNIWRVGSLNNSNKLAQSLYLKGGYGRYKAVWYVNNKEVGQQIFNIKNAKFAMTFFYEKGIIPSSLNAIRSPIDYGIVDINTVDTVFNPGKNLYTGELNDENMNYFCLERPPNANKYLNGPVQRVDTKTSDSTLLSSYIFDNKGRLVRMMRNDLAHNFLTRFIDDKSYTYDSANRLVEVVESPENEKYAYIYDDNGDWIGINGPDFILKNVIEGSRFLGRSVTVPKRNSVYPLSASDVFDDPRGISVQVIYPGPMTYREKYDSQGRLTEWSSEGLFPEKKITYEWASDHDFKRTEYESSIRYIGNKQQRPIYEGTYPLTPFLDDFSITSSKKSSDRFIFSENFIQVIHNPEMAGESRSYYTYDSKGNIVEEVFASQIYFESDVKKTTNRYSYEFDKYGNWIKRTEVSIEEKKNYSENETKTLTTLLRDITYFPQ